MCKKLLSFGVIAVLAILIPLAFLILDVVERYKEEKNKDLEGL